MGKKIDIPKVSIVMRNKNRFAMTSDCLKSLYKLTYPNYEIIIVDDGSTDDSANMLESKFPSVKMIRSREYLGYCKGLNVGIRKAMENGADFVFLVNNDTKDFSENYLKEIVRIFKEDEKVGIVGSRVINYNGKVTWWGQVHQIHKRLGVNSNIPGCGFVVRSKVFNEIGLLDEGLFRFFEDLDFIIRLRKAGYKTAFTNSVQYAHLGGGTTSRTGFEFHYYRMRNIFIFLHRHGSQMSILNKIRRFIGLVSLHILIIVRCIIHGKIKSVFLILNAMLQGTVAGLTTLSKG